MSVIKPNPNVVIRRWGIAAIVGGIAAPLAGFAARHVLGLQDINMASAMAAAVLLFAIGLVLILPDVLTANGKPSAMRVAVVALVAVFCALATRAGWASGELPKIDWPWSLIVAAAVVSKAIQSSFEK